MVLAEWINIIFVVTIVGIIFIWLALYLFQRQDKLLLEAPPVTATIPFKEYELAKQKLELERAEYTSLSSREKDRKSASLKRREEELTAMMIQVQEEQRTYFRTCEERDLAWKEYRDYYREIGFWGRLFSLEKEKELQKLRELYMETEKSVELEKNKLVRKYRVKQIEKEAEQTRKENKESFVGLVNDAMSEISEKEAEIVREETKTPVLDNNPDTPEAEPELPSDTEVNLNEGDLKPQGELLDGKSITQYNFNELYPDYSNRVYIDEEFALGETRFDVVQEANFNSSYFVAIHFIDRIQFQNCDFSNADLSQMVLSEVDQPHRFLNCDFTDTRLNGSTINYAAFYQCRFEKTDWREVQLKRVKFVNCDFTACDISDVDFSSTVMSHDMLEMIDFESCRNPPKNWNAEAQFKGDLIAANHEEEG